MNIQKNVDLTNFSTIKLGGSARYLLEVRSSDEVIEALTWANHQNLGALMVGGGSNIVWQDSGFNGLVLVNKITGFEILNENSQSALIKVGAGENWDLVVEKTVSRGLSGIECLSLIPGTAGATPIQNVGAYGQEISNSLVSIEAIEVASLSLVTLTNDELNFSYRSSMLKHRPGEYFITSINFSLPKSQLSPPFYTSLQLYLNQHNIEDYSPESLRRAVIAIRSEKLPDPKIIANCGSFFANPIISNAHLDKLQKNLNLQIPHWSVGTGEQKIAAAWLIESVGFKDVHDQKTGIGTWKNQPLVLVNESAKSSQDLFDFRDKIIDLVMQKFGITLAQEPITLPY
jgi:UDP-N-acetylmuramate dehydrogenase